MSILHANHAGLLLQQIWLGYFHLPHHQLGLVIKSTYVFPAATWPLSNFGTASGQQTKFYTNTTQLPSPLCSFANNTKRLKTTPSEITYSTHMAPAVDPGNSVIQNNSKHLNATPQCPWICNPLIIGRRQNSLALLILLWL